MFKRSFIVLFLLASVVYGEPPKLIIPAEVRPAGDYVRFTPDTDAIYITYIGMSGVDSFPSEELKDGRRFLMNTRGLPAGRYKFSAVGAGKNGEQTRTDFIVVVGDPGPLPPGPNPPVPPVPPPPTPGDNLQVLVVFEKSQPVTIEQRDIYLGKFRDYLNAKAAKFIDPENGKLWPEWRMMDKDQKLSNEREWVKAAMTEPRSELPWIIIYTGGKKQFSGKLPVTAAEALKLVTQYGG